MCGCQTQPPWPGWSRRRSCPWTASVCSSPIWDTSRRRPAPASAPIRATASSRRIRKANEASQSKPQQIPDLYRLSLHYALFVTSLPAEYGMAQLFALYRIRWQVELALKVWKSVLAIHRLRSAKRERVLRDVYGKPIIAVLVSSLSAAAWAFLDGLAVSPHKVARHVRAVAAKQHRPCTPRRVAPGPTLARSRPEAPCRAPTLTGRRRSPTRLTRGQRSPAPPCLPPRSR